MKKYIKELLILFLQFCMFYIYPMFMSKVGAIGMVIVILLATLLLALLLGVVSRSKLKFIYPFVIALLFVPTVWIYYNESAMVHAIWYLVVSMIGVCAGSYIYAKLLLFLHKGKE